MFKELLKRNIKRKTGLVLLMIFVLLCQGFNVKSQIKMVSGFETEIYHQFAKDIQNNTDVPLIIYPTKGSVDNFEKLTSDSIQIAFMQYDVLLYKELENTKIKDYIKIFFPLYDEEIHLIAKNNNKINSLHDLAGKRVAVGSEGAGSQITAEFIKLKSELEWIDYNIPFEHVFSALLSDSIDAFFFVGAAPANALKSLSSDVKNIIKLVPIKEETLDDIYKEKIIEAGTYSWANYDVHTYSVKSLLVVNTKNIPKSTEKEIDLLYNDLQESLEGIKKNKLSHPKWHQVDFSDMDNIDWPVYKKEYVTVKNVFNLLAYIAVILTFFQIYFVINKLWKRKHERLVAESISISAMFISILINSFFAFKNIIGEGVPQLIANVMWIVTSTLTAFIGVGFWVAESKGKSLWVLLKQALKLESQEAGDLAKAFFRPSGADKIIDILGQIAMIDDDLDDKEREFIQTFADAWGIDISWDYIEKNMGSKSGMGFHTLRKSMIKYLETSPPYSQVMQLGDVLNMLVNADEKVTQEEELILAELMGLIEGYLGSAEEKPVYKVAVVPQTPEQNESIQNLLQGQLSKQEIAGGFAYLSEPFFSDKYAEIVCEQYRSMCFFTVVVQPDKVEKTREILKTVLPKTD